MKYLSAIFWGIIGLLSVFFLLVYAFKAMREEERQKQSERRHYIWRVEQLERENQDIRMELETLKPKEEPAVG